MLSAQLKESTKVNHQLLEKKLVAKMRAIQNTADYTQLLSSFYGFYAGLEVSMDIQTELSFLPDYSLRRKSCSLAADLGALNNELPTIAFGENLPYIKNYLQIIGILYVMEGSTLGGKFIAKMIQAQLKTTEIKGFSFFSSYGDKTESMWQIFKESIDGICLNPIEKEEIVLAANETFLHFSNWFDKN